MRKAGEADLPAITALARSLDLDYPGMDNDTFWVAEEEGRIFGMVGLKQHPDCLELCALGVDLHHRSRGTGRALVAELKRATAADIHLGTVIPGFFESCGFVKTEEIPGTFLKKRKTAWCEGCDVDLCTVMVSRSQ